MLQQTQVARVLRKYGQFLAAFPTVLSLSRATTAEVLGNWQGLGYNRRALALHRAARIIVAEHQGAVPRSPVVLQRLPGIGPASAAAVCVFAYDLPLPIIETNVRSAVIHHFFQEGVSVPDSDILPVVELTLDRDNPRDWYYALMDYGAWIKKTHANPSRRSRHHTVQSPFAGSRRQVRATILRALLAVSPSGMALEDIQTTALLAGRDSAEIQDVLEQLIKEGFVVRLGQLYRVA
jgi:A/G-specific adenine glycosylase